MSEPRPAAPTVMRRVLGRRLQTLREQAGLTYEQAAEALDVTHVTIRRMEKAEVGLKSLYVEKLLHTYGVADQQEIDEFLALARRANKPGWWQRYRDVLPGWFSAYVSLEGEASVIRAYEPHYVPGLLQTEDYAHAVLRAGLPHASPAELGKLVDLRMERQQLLAKADAPSLWVVMDETVFRRSIAGRNVMRAQIAHLMETSEMPNVAVQVIPFEAGPHPAMYGPFHIFRFRIQEQPDVVCVESLTGVVYVEDRSDVSAYLEALDRMCAQAAPALVTGAVLGEISKEI